MKRKRPDLPAVARVSAPELTAERFRAEFAEAHAPCVLERCAHDWPALEAWTFAHLRRAVPEETLVEVACSRASRRGGDGLGARPDDGRGARALGAVFSGDDREREDCAMAFGTLVDLAESSAAAPPPGAAAAAPPPHFARGRGVDYYLCQCPLESRDADYPAVLAPLRKDVRLPRFVDAARVHSLNLWLSASGATRSNAHYDANHGILVVLRGEKRVRLWSPARGARALAPRPVWDSSLHHSRLAVDAADAAGGGGAPPLPPPCVAPVELRKGDALFIPEGWWHQVDSSAGCVAVNIWLEGVRPALCDERVEPYYARLLLARCARRARERAAAAAAREAAASFEAPAERAALGLDDGDADADDGDGSAQEDRARALLLRLAGDRPEGEAPPDAFELALRAMPWRRMRGALPGFVVARPDEWARRLRACAPATIEVLVVRWEAAAAAAEARDGDGLATFYERVFAPFRGGGLGAITREMTDKRDAFARDAFNDALAELAGEGARLGSAAPCTGG